MFSTRGIHSVLVHTPGDQEGMVEFILLRVQILLSNPGAVEEKRNAGHKEKVENDDAGNCRLEKLQANSEHLSSRVSLCWMEDTLTRTCKVGSSLELLQPS